MPAAAQLVYTNVEQERSPHRRRGVQVWLWTESLPPPVREEVEQRVNTFARPGADHFVRRIFSPLVSGPFVMLAEAVPLTKPDKFGRGGRFHTHALLIGREAFAESGGNPFAYFDSGFAFQRDPDAVPDEVWKKVHLPEVELRPVEPHRPVVPAAFAPVVPELVAWLLSGEPTGTVALPMGVADVEAVVREMVRLLPPAARQRLSFDTLWTGKGKHVPRVCGAGNPAMLQAWTFRQFVRFDLSRKAIQPPLAVPCSWAKPLAAWWASHHELTAEDRESAFALAEWLHGTARVPPPATEAAAEWAGRLPAAAERWAAAKRAAVDRACPPAVKTLPGLEARAAQTFGAWSADGLNRVRIGVPADDVVRWAADAVRAGFELDESAARALSAWCADDLSDAGRELALAVTRWIPELMPFACSELRTPAPGREWFRDYCLSTLPERLRGSNAVADELPTLLQPGFEPTEMAELFEAIQCRADPPHPMLDALRLVLRVHDLLGGNPDLMLASDTHLKTWAVERVLPVCLQGFEWAAYTVDGAPPDDWGHLFVGAARPLVLLGVRVPVPTTGRAAVLNYFLREWKTNFLPWVSPHLDQRRFPREDDVADDKGWKEADKLYKKRDVDALCEHLRTAPDAVFRRLTNECVARHATAALSFGMLPDGRSFFIGASAREVNPDDHDRTEPLLRALAASAVPLVRIDADFAPLIDPRHLNRFGWLVVRLLTGGVTSGLGIPPAV